MIQTRYESSNDPDNGRWLVNNNGIGLAMQKYSRILITVLFVGLVSRAIAAPKTDDIRILIDVSASMKLNDPLDHRISALKLFNGLIPDGSKAGVWSIDRYVEMAVKWGTVNDEWREAADSGASTIQSNGIFTNIESGLSRASRGWEIPDPDTRRSIILLTDGQVEISSDADTNEISRQNILAKSIPALKQSGVVVHTIALSGNADEALLKQLALETGGSYQKAESAQDLPGIIFSTFERATQPDTIKLTENRFTIDKNVREMTLLIFRQKHSAPTLLYPPGSSPMSSKKPGNAVWRNDPGYDLITVKNPTTGVWTIDAEVDAGNRLMVETDFKLSVGGFFPYLMPGQPIRINVELHDLGNKITEDNQLQFVDFSIAHTGTDKIEKLSKLEHAGVGADKGRYSYDIANGLEEGTHSFVVAADSQIFNRSKRFDIEVQWPVIVKIDAGNKPGSYQLSIKSRKQYLDFASLRPGVIIQAPDGSKQDLALIRLDNEWSVEIQTSQDGVYQASIIIEASSATNGAQSLDLGLFPMIGISSPAMPQDQIIETSSRVVPVARPVIKPDSIPESISKATTEVVQDKPKHNRQPDWTRISITLALVNLLMIIVAAVVWSLLRRKKDETGLTLVRAGEYA